MSQTYSHMSCARSIHFHSCVGVVSGEVTSAGRGWRQKGCRPIGRLRAFDGIRLCSGIIVSRHHSITHSIDTQGRLEQHRADFDSPPPPVHQIFVVFKMKNGDTCWRKQTHKDVWCSVTSFVFQTGGRCVWNVCHHLLRLVGIDRAQKKRGKSRFISSASEIFSSLFGWKGRI